MRRFQAVVSHRSTGGNSDVNDGSPALESMMIVVVEEVRDSNGHARPSSFNRRECRMIVHDIIREKNLLTSAAPEVQR